MIVKHKLIFITFLITLLTSCASAGHGSRSNLMASLFNTSSTSTQESSIEDESSFDNSAIEKPIYDKIDVDLTTMSSTMVYSEVLNMLDYPNQYVGKIIKMSGPFRPFESTNEDYCYPAIVIQDATACCASGIEFLLYGIPRCSPRGGNGYPALEEEATIVGRFETYIEDVYLYVHLVDAVWLENA